MALGFSQRFGYATHALAYMARKPFGELSTLPEIADWMRSVWPGTSETYLSNVIQRLARAGLLQSHRGIAGGYSLGRPADEISFRDIMEALEGVTLRRCALSLGPNCPKRGGCTIERALFDVEEKYLESLAEINLAKISDEMGIRIPRTASA